jgi:hypothetical protein
MSPLRLGLGVATLTAVLWEIGALTPWHPRPWASLDLHFYFFAAYETFFGAVRAGAPILWNPYQLCGMPWLGTLQGGFFYPPHLLYLILPTPWALGLSTVLHLALAAGGAAAFARRGGVSAAGAILAAAVFAFAGTLRTMQLWPYFLEASAWLPLGALAILEVTGDRPLRGTIALAFASGMSWLAGCPQATVFACYAWAALLAARLVVARPAAPALARAVAGFAVGLGAGVLLGAVALLPGFELAREGIRRTTTLSLDFMYPFGPPPPQKIWSLWLATGSPVLLIAALALVAPAVLSGSRTLVLWGLLVAGIAAAFAAGPATPLFRLYLALPMLGWFRVPHRVLVVGQLALAILAGLGLDVVARGRRMRRLAPLVVLVLLGAVTLEGMRRPEPIPPLPYRSYSMPYSSPHREAYARLAATIGGMRIWPFSPGLMQYSLPPKLATLTHLRSIDDYEPLTLRRQREYFAFFAQGSVPNERQRDVGINSLAAPPGADSPAMRRRLLDLAAVRFMVVPPPTKKRLDVAAFVRDAGLETRPPLAEGLELYENPHVLPRAFVTYCATPAPPAAELLRILSRASFDPLAESWVEGDAGLAPTAATPLRGTAATIVCDEPQVVEIDATLAAPGLVVLADTFYPGWVATVDGAPAAILATNHLFRGVPAPAGVHRIRFEYRPRSLLLGGALSLLTALVLAAGALWSKRHAAA